MSDSRLSQPVTLANGAQVPLAAAVANLALLTAYLADPDSEWDVVYYLREVCLGRPIEPEQVRALVREKLLDPDGGVDSVLRAIVLSSVRGEGRVLHITSPFTDSLDRALADFLIARDHIRSSLSGDEAQVVLDYDPAEQALNQLRRSPKWTEREGERLDPPPDGPGTPPR